MKKPPTSKRNVKTRSLRTLLQGSIGGVVSIGIMAAQPFIESGEWMLAGGAFLTAVTAYVVSAAQNVLDNKKRQGLAQESD